MSISKIQIVNLALAKVGARGTIVDLDELSPNAEVVVNLWDIVFQRVLAERDWKFAQTRSVLQRSVLASTYGYGYAYVVPTNFIRLVKQKKPGVQGGYYGVEGLTYNTPVWPPGFPYAFETLVDDVGNATKCLLIDYDNSINPLMINYIQLITDLTLLTSAFAEALAIALAAEVCIPITEDKSLAVELKQAYKEALNTAEALNEQADYLAEETGSTRWIDAGR